MRFAVRFSALSSQNHVNHIANPRGRTPGGGELAGNRAQVLAKLAPVRQVVPAAGLQERDTGMGTGGFLYRQVVDMKELTAIFSQNTGT